MNNILSKSSSLSIIHNEPLVNIHFFIGLPGSGKTYAAKNLSKEFLKQYPNEVLYIDDLYIELKKNNFNWSVIFSSNQNYKFVIITDFLACDPKQQLFLYNKLDELYPQCKQEWTFFENNPQQCSKNIQLRNNGLKVDLTLQQMTKIYQVSSDIKKLLHSVIILPVYQSPKVKKSLK